ncbi:MAG: PAS domain S-box protein, partial [Methanoregula sp.]
MIPVLYVDDESSLLDVGKQFLEMTGEFSVTTALSASDALDRMKSTQIQAIVSDYQMPGINGIEFLKLVRSTDKLIPFIIFTGKGREEIAIEAFENGADFYLQKGGDPKAQFAELSLKIRTAVEKRTTEQALREQREEMKMFFVVSLDFYAIMTTAGLFVQLNPEWERLLGYPLQELIGKSALEFVHPDDLLSTTAAMEELAKNRPVLNLVNRYRCRDGTYRWLEWRIYPSEGTLFYASARDITERKHDEDALRHSEENYRSLFTTMLNGFAHHEIICDAAGIPVDYRFIDVNPAFERLTGLKREDILGKTALEVLPGLEPVWIERYGKTALTGEQQLFENFSSELGKHFEVNVYSPKTGEFTTIFSDVTERKRAEEALIQNEEKFRTIFDTAANLIITVNRQGFIVDCNERVKDLLGYEKSEIIGQSVAKIIHPDQIVKAQGCLTKILSTGSSYNNIYKMVKKDGAFVDVSINSTGLKDKDGAYFRSVCIIADITEKKHVVDELRESEQRFRT